MLGEMKVPEGYRLYARSEGLDPSTYFQVVKQQPSLSNNQSIEYAGGGFGSSWKLLWRLLSTLLNYKEYSSSRKSSLKTKVGET
jgi:hypothetical protein